MDAAASAGVVAPGAARSWSGVCRKAVVDDTIPQYEGLTIRLEDGQNCHLKPYEYQLLTETNGIRLLRIFPWEERLRTIDGLDIPRCELIHENLNSVPEYTALSYVWGDLLEHSPVVLYEEYFAIVTNSLFEAICWASREADEPVYFWADQICINQQDVVERSVEVRLMGRIYREAFRTIVWLGGSTDDTTGEQAFALMKRLDAGHLPINHVFDLLCKMDRNGLQDILQSHHIDCGDTEPGWAALKTLSYRPWFTRLWTFQEFVVSKKVGFVWSKYHCSSEQLFRSLFATELLRKRMTRGMLSVRLLHLHRYRYWSGQFINILTTLLTIWNSEYQCKDERDRIFSLLGIAGPRNCDIVTVDYNKSAAEIFLEFARETIKRSGSLVILSRRRVQYLANLPSWAPDWSFTASKQMGIDGPARCFSCSKNYQHIHEASKEHNLIVKGKAVSTIREIYSHDFGAHMQYYKAGKLEQFLDTTMLIPQVVEALQCINMQQGDRHRDTNCHWNWLLATTLTGGLFVNEPEATFETDYSEDRRNIAVIILRRGYSVVRHVKRCRYRRLALLNTPTYPLGLVPEESREGDVICILNGSRVPLVLRQKGGFYEVIGECYVNGIMFGEAVDWTQEGGDRFVLI